MLYLAAFQRECALCETWQIKTVNITSLQKNSWKFNTNHKIIQEVTGKRYFIWALFEKQEIQSTKNTCNMLQ
jgi:hypothetical protein